MQYIKSIILFITLIIVVDVGCQEVTVSEYCTTLAAKASQAQVCYQLDNAAILYDRLINECNPSPFDRFQHGIVYLMLGKEKVGYESIDKAIENAMNIEDFEIAEVLRREKLEWQTRIEQVRNLNYQELRIEAFRNHEDCKSTFDVSDE